MFIFDQDFAIEQPKRYYRKLDPFKLRDDGESSSGDSDAESYVGHIPDPNAPDEPHHLHKGTLTRLSKILHLSGKHHHHDGEHEHQHSQHEKEPNGDVANGHANAGEGAEGGGGGQAAHETTLDAQANDAIKASQNVNALAGGKKRIGKDKSVDVSQHTFHIQNSQRRLKLVAKNEVRLFLVILREAA